MKKYFIMAMLCSLFVAAAFTSSAQKIHFSDPTNKWMTFYFQMQGASDGFPVYYRYTFSDSVVHENGKTYSVLNKGDVPLMLVREEGNKVYIKTLFSLGGLMQTDSSEFLYFDYDLQVGDTLKMPLVSPPTTETFSNHVVQLLDSTLINGVWHKVFDITVSGGNLNITYRLTEGLGTKYCGPIFTFRVKAFEGRLVCFQNNGTSPVIELSNCDALGISSQENLQASSLIISPNPAADNILIRYEDQSTSGFQLEITDISGRKIVHAEFDKEIKINVHDFSSGMYFVNISNEEGQRCVRKMIVKH